MGSHFWFNEGMWECNFCCYLSLVLLNCLSFVIFFGRLFHSFLFYFQALFISYGPSFKSEFTTDPFENIELYNLLAGNNLYRPQRSCGQGNIFTPVCHSVHRGVSASVHAGIPPPQSRPPRSSPPRADTPPSEPGTPPGTRHPPGTRYTPLGLSTPRGTKYTPLGLSTPPWD